jgi:hypothetical protein
LAIDVPGQVGDTNAPLATLLEDRQPACTARQLIEQCLMRQCALSGRSRKIDNDTLVTQHQRAKGGCWISKVIG